MRIAVISDLHGSLVALDAVLADIEQKGGADHIVCAGDLVFFGPRPREVIERLWEREIPSVRGNTDEFFGPHPRLEGSPQAQMRISMIVAWGRARLERKHLDYLLGLPFDWRMEPKPGQGVLVVHASPRSNTEVLQLETPADILRDVLKGITARLVVHGHTHFQYMRRVAGHVLVNAGSVGAPGDGNVRAGYALLTWDGESWSAELRRVPYDVEAVIADAAAVGLPDVEGKARRLREGRL